MDCVVEDLSVTDAAGVTRLRAVSAVAAAGQLLAVVGPPGPEKETFLRVITGSLPPDLAVAGRVLIDGEDFSGRPAIEWRRRGLVLAPAGGRPVEPKRSLSRNLLEGVRRAGLPDRERERWLARLLDYFPRLAGRRDVTVANLSHGEQTLLGLALCLAPRPRLLAIERPSLDVSPFNLPETLAAFRQYARDYQAVVVCSEENTPMLLREADQILILQQSRLVFSGSPGDLRADPEARARLGLAGPRPRLRRPRSAEPRLH